MQSGNWQVGSVNGEEGSSLAIQISGPNAGLWADFAGGAGERGDLIDLCRQVKGVQIGEAIRICKEWLGTEAFGSAQGG